jgi:uncharacterized protein YegL
MLQVKMQSKVAENPFYGKSAMKQLLNQGKQAGSMVNMWAMLDSAWKEAKDSKELREGFFIICFSIGEITNRQHNIFGKQKVDNGGNAARPQFMWIMSWLRKNNPTQYYKFMFARIINEFVSFFVILACQIRTMKGKKSINTLDTQTYSALAEHDLNKVADFLAGVILKGSVIDKMMLAKWLVIPRFSKRQKVNRKKTKEGQRDLQEPTKKLMNVKHNLLEKLSEIVKWEMIEHPNNVQFKGLIEWKKQFNGTLESVLFSTKQICNLDREQFFNLLNNCPSGARYRIQRRLMDKEGNSKGKWSNSQGTDLAVLFKEWEKFKETKQQEERVLTEKVRQGDVSEETKAKLEKVKKEAKVNVGGSSLFDEITNLVTGKGNDLLIQSILNKVKFDVPVLLVVDRSGSMGGAPTQVARLLATTAMLKNPSNDVDNLLITFGTDATIYTDKSKTTVPTNRYMSTGRQIVIEKLIDRTQPFSWNFSNLSQIINNTDGSTNIDSVSKRFAEWINSDANLKNYRIEQLQMYPVIMIISDGEFNNSYNAAQSIARMQNTMAQFGWNGVIVVWDVINGSNYGKDPLEGLQNVVHYYGWNLGIINQIFTNIHDLDVIDIYTELKSLWLSNRYTKIKEQVL